MFCIKTEKAFKNLFRSYKDSKIDQDENKNKFDDYLNHIKIPLRRLLRKQLRKYRSMKVNLMIKYPMNRNLEKNENENKLFYSTSRPFTITSGKVFSADVNEVFENLNNIIDTTIAMGSDWVFEKMNEFIVSIVNYRPLRVVHIESFQMV